MIKNAFETSNADMLGRLHTYLSTTLATMYPLLARDNQQKTDRLDPLIEDLESFSRDLAILGQGIPFETDIPSARASSILGEVLGLSHTAQALEHIN